MEMDISVVIPVFNAERTIEACLESLYAQDTHPLEIIVVDNGSTDKTMEIVGSLMQRHEGVPTLLLQEARRGPSFARNRGAFQAQGDIIAFMDSDCMADPSWIDHVSQSFDRTDIGAVAGSVIGFDRQTTFGKFHALFTLRALPSSQLFHAFTLVSGGFPTANLSVRGTLFRSLGGFDENIPQFGEDHDLCARIYRAGARIYFDKEAIVHHKHRKSIKSTWHQSFGFGTGHATLLKKHFSKMLIVELPGWHFLSERWPLRLWLDLASADKKFIFGLFLSVLWPPLSAYLLLYLVYLYRDMGKRLQMDRIDSGFGERWELVLLLLFKSMAITCGRWWGSITHRVLCL